MARRVKFTFEITVDADVWDAEYGSAFNHGELAYAVTHDVVAALSQHTTGAFTVRRVGDPWEVAQT